METVNMGIIGGCMTCQADIKLSQLFYRVLSKELQEKDDIRCLVSLRYYNEYFRIPEKAGHLLKHVKPDTIILQIRPAPFIMRSEFVIQDYQGGFLINPLLFPNKSIEKIETILGTKDPLILLKDELKGFFRKKVIKPLLESNIEYGNLFSLKRKALNSLKDIVTGLHRLCIENHINLYLIGPVNSYERQHNELLSWMNDEIKKLSDVNKITYLDIFTPINENMDQYFGPDKFHLNAEGHALTAGLLYSAIRKQVVLAE